MTLPASLLKSFKGKMKSMGGDSSTLGSKSPKQPGSGGGRGWKPAFAGPMPSDDQSADQQLSVPNGVDRSPSGQSLMSNRPLPDTPNRLPRHGGSNGEGAAAMAPAASSLPQSQHTQQQQPQQQQQQQVYVNQDAAMRSASSSDDGSQQLYMNSPAARQDYIEVDDSESNGPQGSVEPTSDGEATVPSLDPLAPGQTMLVTAIYKYAAAAADELSLIEGSQILVTEVAEDGWVYGSSCLTGAVGWFHGSYVQPDKDAKFVVGAKSFTPAPGSRQAEKALSFSANERLRVLAETSETWWIAQKQTEGRQVGFIPAKYVKLAPLPRPRALKSIKGTSGGGGGVDGDAPDLEPELSVSPDPVPEIWLDLETAEKQYVTICNDARIIRLYC